MEAMPCHSCAAAQGDTQARARERAQKVLLERIDRSVRQRIFRTVLSDIEALTDASRDGIVDDNTLAALLQDRLNALGHLRDSGSVAQALEHAEAALVEAVIRAEPTIKFPQAARQCHREDQDDERPE
jgi:hypothetical protein